MTNIFNLLPNPTIIGIMEFIFQNWYFLFKWHYLITLVPQFYIIITDLDIFLFYVNVLAEDHGDTFGVILRL